jgi:hypothetical protein
MLKDLIGVREGAPIARLGPDGDANALDEPSVRAFDITGHPCSGRL